MRVQHAQNGWHHFLRLYKMSTNILRDHYHELINNTILDDKVLDYLISKCVVTLDDADEVRKPARQSVRNKILLDILLDRPFPTLMILKEAFQYAGATFCLEGDDRNEEQGQEKEFVEGAHVQQTLAVEDHKIRLQKNYINIIEGLASTDNVIDGLIEEDVLTIDDREEITRGTTKEQNRKFLAMIIHKNQAAYRTFINILRQDTCQSDLAKVIEETSVDKHDVDLLVTGIRTVVEENEAVPRHKKEKYKRIIERWREDDRRFIKTNGADSILTNLRTNSCITITGPSGVGKTATMRHTALKMQQEGFYIIPVTDPKDIVDFYMTNKRTLFVVDDLCGNFTANQHALNAWKIQIPEITDIIQNDKNIKIIVSCRTQVFQDVTFQTLKLFVSCEYSLVSEKLCLTDSEKMSIAKLYLGEKAGSVSDKMDYFPLLCRLFKEKTDIDTEDFFQNPYETYKNELDELWNDRDGGRYKVCALLLCILYNNRLDDKYFCNEHNKAQTKMLNDACDACGLNTGVSKMRLKEEINSLIGTFLIHEEGKYRTVHDKLFDFLAFYIGQKVQNCVITHADREFFRERFLWKTPGYVESTKDDTENSIPICDLLIEKYIDRLIAEWSKGEVIDVFTNRNMKVPQFRNLVLKSLTSRDESFQMSLLDNLGKEHEATSVIKSFFGENSEFVEMLPETSGRQSRDTALLFICYLDDTSFLKWIMHHGTSVDYLIQNTVTPLFLCCLFGSLKTTLQLLQENVDVNKGCGDISPISIASKCGHFEIVCKLVKHKADVKRCNRKGTSPLWVASANGHIEIVCKLLENGANVNESDNEEKSPLLAACVNGHFGVVCKLLESGADVNKSDEKGVSPLLAACYYGHEDIVFKLLENGADVNKTKKGGVTPLLAACHNGNTDVVDKLIAKNADVNKCDDGGLFPLLAACAKGNEDIVRILLDNNADVNACDKARSFALTIASEMGYLDIVRKLLRYGSDVNNFDVNGFSPLYLASTYNHLDILLELLKYNCDINKCERHGETSLFVASAIGNENIVQELLKRNADVEYCVFKRAELTAIPFYDIFQSFDEYITAWKKWIKEISPMTWNRMQNTDGSFNDDKLVEVFSGSCPLHIASFMGHTNIVRHLIKASSNVDSVNEHGATPLFLACEFGHIDVVVELRENGASPNICTIDGLSPLAIASQNGHQGIVAILQEVHR